MSIKDKILGLFSGGVMEAVKSGADIVERWAPSAEGKHEMAQEIDKSIESSHNNARIHDTPAPPGTSRTWFDSVVDGINRLVRPTVTLFLFGGVAGFWSLPTTGEVDPIVLAWVGTIMVFWFGGRALFKDLPGVIKYLRVLRKKK